MIQIVTDERSVTKYQKQFVKRLKTVCDERIPCVLGYKGESFETTVFYSNKFDFWFSASEGENRFWNAFGISRPNEGKMVSITVEINFPYKGINRNVGGAIGSDENGEVLILHRGKIGGGRTGIGKHLFFDQIRDNPITANDSGTETEFFVVGSIKSNHFPKQVSNFIREVYRIKEQRNIQKTFSELTNFKFSDEHAGRSEHKNSGTKVVERTHGIVINTLARLLEKNGYKIGNDRSIDLFIFENGEIRKLFEIKTGSTTQDLCSAVGQLLIYSIPVKTKIDLFLVLPNKLDKIIEDRLEEFGLKVIYYDWRDDEPFFPELKKSLKKGSR